jgi:DNA-binding YbaB/EbfC family protein
MRPSPEEFMMKENITELMAQAQKMQQSIQKAQQELGALRVIGVAGAGDVKVHLTGRHECENVEIVDEVYKGPKAALQELVKAAINDAVRKVEGASKQKMSGLMSGLNLPAGFNMPMGGGDQGA